MFSALSPWWETWHQASIHDAGENSTQKSSGIRREINIGPGLSFWILKTHSLVIYFLQQGHTSNNVLPYESMRNIYIQTTSLSEGATQYNIKVWVVIVVNLETQSWDLWEFELLDTLFHSFLDLWSSPWMFSSLLKAKDTHPSCCLWVTPRNFLIYLDCGSMTLGSSEHSPKYSCISRVSVQSDMMITLKEMVALEQTWPKAWSSDGLYGQLMISHSRLLIHQAAVPQMCGE